MSEQTPRNPQDPEATYKEKFQLALTKNARALAKIAELKASLEAAELDRYEPIAIIGMGCRLPGGESPEEFWESLQDARDLVREIPQERLIGAWPEGVPRWAGLLDDDVTGFEPAFFNISPREALTLDPQQRLLLEVCWEALEHSGLIPQRLQGSRTGVFVGMCTHDYEQRVQHRPVETRDAYDLTGVIANTASGRISYTLGLQGPAMTLDTACSSSLVALHLACQSLRTGESDLALAGGVNLILSEHSSIGLSLLQALSPDGRCRTFDASANGFVRGEGCGVVVLKRLRDARRDGDRIRAVIRGSAVNQDGRSTGLTAPNVLSQEALLREALKQARVEPHQVSYIECHGTATPLGDPIETEALKAVYGVGREDGAKLWLGAVKTNIGHLEAAAGVAGVIKAVLALEHGQLPPNLHFRHINPRLRLEGTRLSPLARHTVWEADGPRLAGVSSFGISGTNAHIILEGAPIEGDGLDSREGRLGEFDNQTYGSTGPVAPTLPMLLSSRTPGSLRAYAGKLRTHAAASPALRPVDMAFSLATTRAHFEHRAVVLAGDRETLLEALDALAHDRPHPAVVVGEAGAEGRLAFVFTGQGGQRPGMGRELHDAFPRFRESLNAVCARFDDQLERPLREVMFAGQGSPEASLLDRTDYTQPALFALEVALFRLWEGWGITPDLLAGHSIGELAAAHVAGVLSLEDACTLVEARGRLMQTLPESGAMMSLEASESEVRTLLASGPGRVAIGGVNGPGATVVSGDEVAVVALGEHFRALGRKVTRLQVSHAFHSMLMDGMLEDFARVARSLTFHPARIPLISTLTGKPATSEELCDPEYWVRQVREPVQFYRAVQTLEEKGVRTFLELGPQAVLSVLGSACLPDDAHSRSMFLPSLRKDRSESVSLMTTLAGAHVRGVALGWAAFFAPLAGRFVSLPTYAFQRSRYWVEATPGGRADASENGMVALPHPMLSAATSLANSDSMLLNGQLSLRTRPWLGEHRVFSSVVFPGTGFLEWGLVASNTLGLNAFPELSIAAPLQLPESGATQVQVSVRAPDEAGRRPFTISSRPGDASLESPWTVHCTGELSALPPSRPALDRAPEWPPAGARAVDFSDFYATIRARGVYHGPSFQGLRGVWTTEDAVYAHAVLPAGCAAEAGDYRLHPALLEAGLHALAASLSAPAGGNPYLPVEWQGVELFATGARELRLAFRALSGAENGIASVSIQAWDGQGQPVLRVDRLVLREVAPETWRMLRRDPSLFTVTWKPVGQEPTPGPDSGTWVWGPPEGLARGLAGIHIADQAELTTRLPDSAPPGRLVIDAGFSRGGDWPASAREHVHEVLDVLKPWLADERLASVELVVVTRRAVSTGPDDRIDGLASSPLWGLIRSARTEHPERRLRLLDLDEGSTFEEIRAALRIQDEPELALRSGTLRAARLIAAKRSTHTWSLPASEAILEPHDVPLEVRAAFPRQIRTDGTVLIVGGTGALGRLLARHLAQAHGIRRLLLVSRSGPVAPGAEDLKRELNAAGVQVSFAACDAGVPDALAAILAAIPIEAPLRAVFHCAGVLDDAPVAALTPERVDRVLSARIDAAWHLHTLTRQLDLDAFVLFSSAAGILGSAGQASYAAANAGLDALAGARRNMGLAGQSLAWGPWEPENGGMTAGLGAADLARMARAGLSPLSAAQGLELLDEALLRAETVLVPVRLNAERAAGWTPALLRGMIRRVTLPRASVGAVTTDPTLRARLEALPVEQRPVALIEMIQQEAAVVLGLSDASSMPATRSFKDAGMDSLVAMDLRNRLQRLLDVRINASAIWRAETPALLAAELAPLLGTTAPATPPPPPPGDQRVTASSNRPRLAPLSPGQERLWFLDKVLARRESYNLHVALKLSTRIDHVRLKDALDHVVGRHEQLRVCFVERGTACQRVLPWVESELPLHDLSALPPEERSRTLDALSHSQAKIPFNLEKPPLFRVSLFHLGVDESALILTFHHITTDGRSFAVFLRELLLAYEAAGAGREPHLPPVSSFLEYSDRSNAWLETEAADAHRRWWKAELAGLDPLTLATDRQAPGEPTQLGGLVDFRLSASLSQALEALARDSQCTPFVILLAAWSTLLSRYSSQTGFALGTITMGRNEPGLEDVIGFFINTLPVRCDLSGDPTVGEYLTRVRARVWSVLDHQELPFQEIVRVAAAQRSGAPSRNQLFRVNFVLEESSWFQGSFAGTAVEPLMRSVSAGVEGTAKFDLSLAMVRTGEGYRASLEYSSDLFNASTIERMARHFQTLLEDFVHHPEKRISWLELLDADERHRVLFGLNETATPYPQDACLHELIEDQAGRTPDAVALRFEAQELTYRELNSRANQLAHHLRSQGVGPDTLVGLCVERSLEMIVGLLGILKAGGAYVALDPTLPTERLTFLLEDSQAPFLVTQQRLVDRIPAAACQRLCLDSQRALLEGESAENPPRVSSLKDLVYVIYTSGSTGRPKGVAVEHGCLLNYTFGLIERLGLERGSYATLSTLAADLGNTVIFPSLYLGGTLHVISQELITDAEAFVAYARRHRLDCLKITPSHFRALQSASGARDVFPSRWLILGGEALPAEWCRKLAEQRPSCRIFNHYGPTETTIGVLTHSMDVETLEAPTLPLGRPLPNSRIYVLDANLRPTPIGVPGELYIGGPGVSRGYWNRTDLTHERFLPDPYGPDGSRMYRTGDLGRFLEGGELEFLGRIDQQVKVRGHRVELGEIEAVLEQLPEVETGVVVARDDASGSKRLLAYVVPSRDMRPTVQGLRTALLARLPDYMVPSTFVVLDAMPLTPNGKTDRKALPSPQVDRAHQDDRLALPRTPGEVALASIWREVLRLDRVGIHDNFFSLGGDSLSVIRIVSRAARAGYPLKPRDLFTHQTVAELARALSTIEPCQGDGQKRCLVPLRAAGHEPPVILVPGIEGTLLGHLAFTRRLRPSIPVWGFETPEMVGEYPAQTLEELVRSYVGELSEQLPGKAPFRLAGHSLGGTVVLELARQLLAAGLDVEGVFLLDARPLWGARFESVPFLAGLSGLLGGFDLTPEYLSELGPEGAKRAVADDLKKKDMVPGPDAYAFVSRLLEAARRSLERVSQWTPRAVDVPITLLKASATRSAEQSADYGWSEWLQRTVDVVRVAGDHFTMLLEPHVASVARCLQCRMVGGELLDEGDKPLVMLKPQESIALQNEM